MISPINELGSSKSKSALSIGVEEVIGMSPVHLLVVVFPVVSSVYCANNLVLPIV